MERQRTRNSEAVRNAAHRPVVPGATAGYSGTPLPKKLGIRKQCAVLLVNAPNDFERTLGSLPEGAEFVDDPFAARVALLFASSQTQLAHDFRALARALPNDVAFWIAWPKRASRMRSDLCEKFVRETALAAEWVDYKVCAIDQTWSGLCFARKRS